MKQLRFLPLLAAVLLAGASCAPPRNAPRPPRPPKPPRPPHAAVHFVNPQTPLNFKG